MSEPSGSSSVRRMIRGATAGTAGALCAVIVFELIGPPVSAVVQVARNQAVADLARTGVTSVGDATVTSGASMFESPGRALLTAGVALVVGVVGGLVLAMCGRPGNRRTIAAVFAGIAWSAIVVLALLDQWNSRWLGATAAGWTGLAFSWWWSGRPNRTVVAGSRP